MLRMPRRKREKADAKATKEEKKVMPRAKGDAKKTEGKAKSADTKDGAMGEEKKQRRLRRKPTKRRKATRRRHQVSFSFNVVSIEQGGPPHLARFNFFPLRQFLPHKPPCLIELAVINALAGLHFLIPHVVFLRFSLGLQYEFESRYGFHRPIIKSFTDRAEWRAA